MRDLQITIVGNLTADPELRFTPSGAAVAGFTIAHTPASYDSQTREWKDGNTLFLRCSAWRQLAENVSESLRKGMRVIASGRLRQRDWEDNDGNRRSTMELDVTEIGPSLSWATADVTRNQSRSATPAGGMPGPSTQQQAAQTDPWGTSGEQQSNDWGANPGGQLPAGDWGTPAATPQAAPPF